MMLRDELMMGPMPSAVLPCWTVARMSPPWAPIPGTRKIILGAMDLIYGAKRVIVITEHVNKKGEFKIVKECTYPLTGKACVSMIVTDISVIERAKEGFVLKEFAPGWTAEDIQSLTEPKLIVADDLKEFEL